MGPQPRPATNALLAIAATAMLAGGLALPARAATAASLADVAWLAGCWHARGGEPGSEEHWLAPAGGTMLGVGRTVRKGRTVEYELMSIEERDGTLVFAARPSGQPPAEFALLRASRDEVVFENATHDFPQRVAYRRDGTGIVGRIEGTQGGKTKAIDFPFERGACEPAAAPAPAAATAGPGSAPPP